MSDLRPKGRKVKIREEEHRLLFSLNVVDAVQSKYKQTTSQVLMGLLDKMNGAEKLRFLLTELLNDEKRRNGETDFYEEETVGSFVAKEEIPYLTANIINAYEEAIPEEKEEGGESRELLDIAQLILLATTKMGYREEEVFAMTPRKFFLLFDSFLDMNHRRADEKMDAIDRLP